MNNNIVDLSEKNKKTKTKIAGLWCSKFGEDYNLIEKYEDFNWKNYKIHERIQDKYVKKFINLLSRQLNQYHNLKWNKTNYEILIGMFVRNSVYIFYDRWKIIHTLLSKNKKLRLTKSKEFFMKSDKDLVENYDNKDFNNFVFNHIINFLIKTKKIKNNSIVYAKQKRRNIRQSKKKVSFKKIISNLVSKIYLKSCKIAILNPYLPKLEEIKLNIKLKNFPYMFFNFHLQEDDLNNFSYNINKRKIFFSNYKNVNLFEECFLNFLEKIFPSCYLENFNECLNRVNKIKEFPQVVGITVAHNTNIFVKIFLILSRIKTGCKILSWQHGGQEYYRNIPDIFCKNLKAFSNKVFNWSKKSKKNPNGLFYIAKFSQERKFKSYKISKITIFFGCHSYYNFPVGYDEFFYMNFDNYKNLKFVTDTVFLRLNSKNIFPCVRPFFQNKSNKDYYNYIKKNFKIDKTFNQNFQKVLDKTSLCVYFVDTTAFYNSLYSGIPSILIISDHFMKKGFKNKKIYKQMFHHNILFTCPIKASNFIIKIKNSGMHDWWFSKKNKNFLKNLKSDYIFKSKNRVEKLYKILNSNLN